MALPVYVEPAGLVRPEIPATVAPATAVTTDMEINAGRIGMEKREW